MYIQKIINAINGKVWRNFPTKTFKYTFKWVDLLYFNHRLSISN